MTFDPRMPKHHETATSAETVTIGERTITTHNPLTGEVAGIVTITEPEEVEPRIARSRTALDSWGSLTHDQRKPFLRAYTKAAYRNIDRIAAQMRAETGKDLAEATAEVAATLIVMDFFSRKAKRLLAPKRAKSWPFLTTKGWTEYHPIGVAGIISPWNYPFYLPMISSIQALAAGCTVVLKPSEVTPATGQLLEDLAVEAGLPKDVVQVIHGAGDTGAALVRSSCDVVSFTGSTEVGKRIAEEAAGTLKPVILELGGKDAMIVLEDADLASAAKGAVSIGAFNAGQTCVAVERVYVVDQVYDEFVNRATDAMGKLRAGTQDRRDVGPLISPPQVKIIEDQVDDAVAKGARVLLGGKRMETDHAIYYEPTVLVDVDHSMDVMREETFGPVLAIMRVPDEDAAVQLANDSRYGLHGSVWTRSKSRGERIASRMQTGSVAINDHLVNFFVPSMVLGGIKESGVGGQLGEEGIKAFCIHKSVTEARFKSTTRLIGMWLPRRVGPGFWKTLARSLVGWRR